MAAHIHKMATPFVPGQHRGYSDLLVIDDRVMDTPICLLSLQQWEAALGESEILEYTPWIHHRAATVCVAGLWFSPRETPPGTLISIKDEVCLEILNPTLVTSARIDRPRLAHALQKGWRAGVTCRIIEGRGATIEHLDLVCIGAPVKALRRAG